MKKQIIALGQFAFSELCMFLVRSLAGFAGQRPHQKRIPPGRPALYYLEGGAWVKEPSSALDQIGRAVTATSRRLEIWALMGEARWALMPIQR